MQPAGLLICLAQREVWGSIPIFFHLYVKSDIVSRDDGLRYLLHASAKYREYNEDLTFCFWGPHPVDLLNCRSLNLSFIVATCFVRHCRRR